MHFHCASRVQTPRRRPVAGYHRHRRSKPVSGRRSFDEPAGLGAGGLPVCSFRRDLPIPLGFRRESVSTVGFILSETRGLGGVGFRFRQNLPIFNWPRNNTGKLPRAITRGRPAGPQSSYWNGLARPRDCPPPSHYCKHNVVLCGILYYTWIHNVVLHYRGNSATG